MRVERNSDVVVFGTGAVGLAEVMAAKVAGAAAIIAVDLNDERLALARELGATHTERGDAEHLAKNIRRHSTGAQRYVLDTTGKAHDHPFGTRLDAARWNVLARRAQSGELVLDAGALFGKTVTGIIERSADPHEFIPVMIDLWQQGRFAFERLIRSGEPRTSPLMYLADEDDSDRVYVFASAAGASQDPAWLHNLVATPNAVTVEIGPETLKADPQVLPEERRTAIYAIQAERYPGFADYQAKTSRRIPVVALTLHRIAPSSTEN